MIISLVNLKKLKFFEKNLCKLKKNTVSLIFKNIIKEKFKKIKV